MRGCLLDTGIAGCYTMDGDFAAVPGLTLENWAM
jgi:hypothetical protein